MNTTIALQDQQPDISDFKPINSKLIRKAYYNRKKQELTIEYHRGGIYIFSGVPQAVYEDLYKVPSPGKYLLNYVHDYNVRTKKINTHTSWFASFLVLLLNRFC